MKQRNIIVVGASTGGIEALKSLMAALPPTLPATLFVVVHLSPASPGVLPAILARAGPLPVQHAVDKAAILASHIYVAPPDRHLVLERGRMRLTQGPKENRFRPAVDPLFRSAAVAYGSQVIGVILSGALDDGTAGLQAVKQQGGVAIVQEPSEAFAPSMPRSALQHVAVDYCVRMQEMAAVLVRLVSEVSVEGARPMSETLQIETRIAFEDNALELGVLELGPISPYTCPDCHGVLVQLKEGSLLRFRCHTGHAFSIESLLSAIRESTDDIWWTTVRVLNEQMLLLRHLTQHVRDQQEEGLAQQLAQAADQIEQRVQLLRQQALR